MREKTGSTLPAVPETAVRREYLHFIAKTLTQHDYSGNGLQTEDIDPQTATVRVEINPRLPAFTFRLTSGTATSSGRIEIFKDTDLKTAAQVIDLPNDLWVYGKIASSFNVQDINFDGFSDIGIQNEGGAKWGSYQYWMFDHKSGKFTETPFSDEFKKITFNNIKFDQPHKQIITNHFCGVLLCEKDIYTVSNGKIKLSEKYEQEQIYEHDEIVDRCVITHTVYSGGKPRITAQTINQMCTGYETL